MKIKKDRSAALSRLNKNIVLNHLQNASLDDIDAIMHMDMRTVLYLALMGLDTLWENSEVSDV